VTIALVVSVAKTSCRRPATALRSSIVSSMSVSRRP
jgi:hypothetical protein